MRELIAVALAFVAALSYFAAATGFALYQRWPVVHFALLLAAAALVLPAFGRRAGWRKLFPSLALVFCLGLTGLFAWYTLDYSTYASTSAAVEVGDVVGEELGSWRLPSHAGAELPVLRPGLDRVTLLVFYRGHW